MRSIKGGSVSDFPVPFRMSRTVGVTGSPSAFVVLGCSWFGNVDGLLQRSSQVDGALLDHLPDVFDPVLLVLDARCLLLVNNVKSSRSQKQLEFNFC